MFCLLSILDFNSLLKPYDPEKVGFMFSKCDCDLEVKLRLELESRLELKLKSSWKWVKLVEKLNWKLKWDVVQVVYKLLRLLCSRETKQEV